MQVRHRILGPLLALATTASGVTALGQPALATAPSTSPSTATVRTPGIPLSVRSGPATRHGMIRRLPNGARVNVECQTHGQPIRSHRTTTATWAKLTRGGYASAAYLTMPSGAPGCRRGSTAITGGGPPPSPREFMRHASAGARHSARRYRIPASVTIAQAMLESSWGASALALEGNNYFGIKCIGGAGPIAVGCRKYRTFECGRKKGCYRTYAWFRTYRSVRDSFADHARLLTRAGRYQSAMRHTSRPNRFAVEVHRAGYATDPRYSRKLISLMRAHNLYRFD